MSMDIKNLMQKYEQKLVKIFDYKTDFKYSFPWNRKFEVEISE